jgi:CRP/FNR family transcriptional regulator, cyclic AMP receptor protein
MEVAISTTPQTLSNRSPHSQTLVNFKVEPDVHSGRARLFDCSAFLLQAGPGRKIVDLKEKQTVFLQGDPADAVFYIQSGKVSLSIVSSGGKEAIIALLDTGDFLGEECIATSRRVRMATAMSMADSTVLRIDRREMLHALQEHHPLSDVFVSYLLSRNLRLREDLVDQLLNSSEKRLARGPVAARTVWHGSCAKDDDS